MSKHITRQLTWPALILVALITGVFTLAACGDDSVEAILDTAEASVEEITVGISMYVLVDDLENPDPAVSSRRSEEELTVILAGMNEIWGQANIRLELDTLDTIAVDSDVLKKVAQGNGSRANRVAAGKSPIFLLRHSRTPLCWLGTGGGSH